ncbi:MAG: M23 family metallopeptidase [Flavobacteriaceae bacterium]|nr:M23 family metallopeptidase [Flavobacteriaceae bacterium]
MAKEKYFYDSDTLSYKKVRLNKSYKIKKGIFLATSILLTSFIGWVVFSQIFESPKQKQQKRELENLELNYSLLNKKLQQATHVLDDIADRDNNIYRMYFEASPIPLEQRKAGFGGVNRYKDLEGYNNSEMIINTTQNLDRLSKQLKIQSESLDEIVTLAKNKEEMLASIPAIMPVKKGNLTRMASGYGMRMHPTLKYRKMHEGMDFSAKKGTSIYASGNGVITRADRSATYGNVVYIDHGYGYETRYAHMSKIKTSKGKKVKRGEVIGLIGNTGRSVAPHLHYEVRYNKKSVNPMGYYFGNLTPTEFVAMQKASMQEGQSFD